MGEMIFEGEYKIKSNFHVTRRIKPKRVTSGRVHFRGLAPEDWWATQLQRNIAAVASRWRHYANLTGLGMERRPVPIAMYVVTELTAFGY